MNKDPNVEKQIEEMAKDFCAVSIPCEECHLYKNRCHAKKYATRAYNTGYRKASEVARGIFEEIENALGLLRKCIAEGRKNDGIKYQQLHDGRIISLEAIAYFTAELKKKYIGKDINVTTNTEET